MKAKKILAMALAVGMTLGLTGVPTFADDKKTFVFGDTTFNAENEEADINPQNTYAGWACIRYGVGETLFRYSDTMEIEPWIAKEYENIDELTWKITLNDGVVFSNGRACDGEAVKECLEALVANHERAAGDLCIDTIEADGNTITIKTTEPKPALINYLSDSHGNCLAYSRIRGYRAFKIHPCIKGTACCSTGEGKILIFKNRIACICHAVSSIDFSCLKSKCKGITV